MRYVARLLLVGSTLAASFSPAAAQPMAAPAPPRTSARMAVLVGANAAAPGRTALQYSHRDVERMAEVLVAVGGFAAKDVLVLKDPSPGALLGSLLAASRRLARAPETLLYFFYSGHADETALYPGGIAVPLASVRELIDQAEVSVKIGVVDACRGGSWTRTKGLVAEDPFAVKWPLSLDNEGSVLIASSSGIESAHESDALQGSFFTYHFTGGLRGAADRNGDGVVTLSEGFEYAKEHTIRDTLRLTRETQRPSYAVNLRGRRDLVLARVMASPSSLAVAQTEGPLEILHADSGLQMVELPPGPRRVKLAVPPGTYLVRKRGPRGNLLREVVVAAGAHTTIAEEQLTLVGHERLVMAMKGAPLRPAPAAAPTRPVSGVGPAAQLTAPAAAEDSSGAPLWTKMVATSTGVVAALSLGLTIKFALDSLHYDKELDQYRRFACRDDPGRIGCDSSGSVQLPPLTRDQEFHRDELRQEGRYFERLGAWTALLTLGSLVTSAGFSYYWWRAEGDDQGAARSGDRVSWQLVPTLTGSSQGLTGIARF